MPNDNNDDDLKNLSIDEINELYSDIIDFTDVISVGPGRSTRSCNYTNCQFCQIEAGGAYGFGMPTCPGK